MYYVPRYLQAGSRNVQPAFCRPPCQYEETHRPHVRLSKEPTRNGMTMVPSNSSVRKPYNHIGTGQDISSRARRPVYSPEILPSAHPAGKNKGWPLPARGRHTYFRKVLHPFFPGSFLGPRKVALMRLNLTGHVKEQLETLQSPPQG